MSKSLFYFSILVLTSLFVFSCSVPPKADFQVENYEKLTLNFQGPATSEQDAVNPFLNYRLNVTFTNANQSITIPGFYSAEENVSESSADSGNNWKVRFRPNLVGTWNYSVSFRKGDNIAVSTNVNEGEAISFNGQTGIIKVLDNPSNEGRLEYVGERYLQYSQSKRYFIKGGADSPENVFGFIDFDGTERGQSPEERKGEAKASKELHKFPTHVKDWNDGDPTWKGGKGKALVGGLNYLASKGINSLYFLTCNIDGDGKDVYPYTSYDERHRFDCSKLDQWEIVMDHMDKIGIMQHLVFQETENELMLDGGDTKNDRKLYLREMIARFGHHPRLIWNMGEENGPVYWRPEGQNTEQQKAMVQYVKETDPYKNLTVIHSHSEKPTRDELFTPLLGFRSLDGMSTQVEEKKDIHEVTKQWLESSAKSGKQWVMNLDEIGPYYRGVDPDDREDNNQDTVRAEALWGNLMAGGAGAEWYFGSENHSNDLTCEDWRTRDRMWGYTSNAVKFFENHVPFHKMHSSDDLIKGEESYCFSEKNETYLVYLLFGGKAKINLEEAQGTYDVKWYDPRNGGDLQRGSITEFSGGEINDLGTPPNSPHKDWAILITKIK